MIYIYKCENGHETKIDLPMADDKPQEILCEQCGEVARKLFNLTPFRFKGYNRQADNSRPTLGKESYS